MPKGYYTVNLIKSGFPVYFLCPNCQNIHSYPEHSDKATFQDPGEASQEFLSAFFGMADWVLVSPFDLLFNVDPKKAFDLAYSLFEKRND